MTVSIAGSQCDTRFLEGTAPIDEDRIFSELVHDIKSNNSRVAPILNFPNLSVNGNFNDLVTVFKNVIEPKRKNQEISINLKKIVEAAVDQRQIRIKYDSMAPII